MIVHHFCSACGKVRLDRDSDEIYSAEAWWRCHACFATMPKPTRRKMGNVPCFYNFRRFPSKAEAHVIRTYEREVAREHGEIDRVIVHPQLFVGLGSITYCPDAMTFAGVHARAIEVKGRLRNRPLTKKQALGQTPIRPVYGARFTSIIKAWREAGSCPLDIVQWANERIKLVETIPGGWQE